MEGWSWEGTFDHDRYGSAISCGAVTLGDILMVWKVGAEEIDTVKIRINITKGSRNWGPYVTLEGSVGTEGR
ncbi:hypothetical protein BLNAU_14439 [Blattamonas nauphoetae]|uniref:Uncharacterized protein n=1 Tax=Blattamonas nauphoetae TaxID=2049346 RepID=A0ABQ9XDR7_9EUKA|nr:hypothetical protein BLNAU_14439 [Blattamonas nauphoetae]